MHFCDAEHAKHGGKQDKGGGIQEQDQKGGEYVSSVPRDFRFSIKVPNSLTLTHQYQKGKKGPLEPNPHFLSNELFDDFLFLLQPMAKQIDSLIFQFEYLNKQKMPSQLEFQNKLYGFFLGCSPDYPYCIEIRNQNYLNRPYFEFLQDLGLSHVFLQGYWMPPIFEIYGRFKKHIEKQVCQWARRIEPFMVIKIEPLP